MEYTCDGHSAWWAGGCAAPSTFKHRMDTLTFLGSASQPDFLIRALGALAEAGGAGGCMADKIKTAPPPSSSASPFDVWGRAKLAAEAVVKPALSLFSRLGRLGRIFLVCGLVGVVLLVASWLGGDPNRLRPCPAPVENGPSSSVCDVKRGMWNQALVCTTRACVIACRGKGTALHHSDLLVYSFNYLSPTQLRATPRHPRSPWPCCPFPRAS